MDRGRRITRLTAGLLAGLVLVGATPGEVRTPRQVAQRSAPTDVPYRLGYTSNDQQTLSAREPGGPARSVLPAGPPSADYDAQAGAGGVVFVSRRPTDQASDLHGDIYLLRRGASAPARLTNDDSVKRYPAISPDGRRVAFAANRGGNDDIWVVNTSGAGLRQLTTHPGEDTWPTWSPDGTRIAFSSTRDDPKGDIYVVDATGGTPTRLTSDPAADTEPAWSPDGTRIAFTTTRFRSYSDVVTMTAAGGPVKRAVPGPWDSSQPAWSADGLRLAVVTNRFDPAGDIVAVSGKTVTPVAAGAGTPESHPTWLGAEVIYTDQAGQESADIWSAVATGGDRLDLSGRLGDEGNPVFTADGFHLAYSAGQPGGGRRIVVADADGANSAVLSPMGTLPGDRDTAPTWSPDGTMLAFTRSRGSEPAQSWTMVMRVADGQLVGEIPIPYYLKGDDYDPAWSPDGKQIAITRDAAERSSRLSEPFTDQPAVPGGQVTVEEKVPLPTPFYPPKPEVVFLIDKTLSMQQAHGDWRGNLRNMVDTIHREYPEARFGVTEFNGRFDVFGFEPYERRLALTGDVARVKAAINDVPDDEPNLGENWFYGLTRIAADQPGDGPGFSQDQDTSKIVVLVSDTYTKPEARRTPFPELKPISIPQLTNALTSAGIYFVGASLESYITIPILGTKIWIETPMTKDPDDVAGRLARETHGQVVSGANLADLTNAVRAGIKVPKLAVRPEVKQCDGDLSVDFKANPGEVVLGKPAVFAETVHVSASARPEAELHCTVMFNTDRAEGPPEEYLQQITVRVEHPDRPFVRVDDVTVTASRPEGVKVEYTATALDPHDGGLTPTCTPASGSTFPIGQTIVTCTATNSAGTGTDIAKINVLDRYSDTEQQIWLASLRTGADGLVHFGDQVSFSARRGGDCERGVRDQQPAWAPDGKQLAFVTEPVEARPRICVASVDGDASRDPLVNDPTEYQWLSDPAWSPDGTEIAYTLELPGESRRAEIRSVPSTGGVSTLRIGAATRAEDPAYQVMPPSDLRVSVGINQRPGYVGGGDLKVTFIAVNDSPAPAHNAWLSVSLPAGLSPTVTDPRCSGSDGSLVCEIGDLGIGDTYLLTAVLHTLQGVNTVVSGRLVAAVGQQRPTSRESITPVVVRQPAIVAGPAIGPPGFVTEVRGVDFPPGATVRLAWQPGITATPDSVVVNPDGTFYQQQLVMRKDSVGPRLLQAARVSGGSRFGTVGTDFLVVPRALDPPIFDGRG